MSAARASDATTYLTEAAQATTPIVLDPLMDVADADAIRAAVLAAGPYELYAAEQSHGPIASKVAERYDAARHYVRSGGYAGEREDASTLIRRTGYFRSTLMQGRRVVKPGFEQLNELPALEAAAHRVYDHLASTGAEQPVVEPAILYLNLYVPGQELAIHIDVPEFVGAERSITPQWLLVVMRASGLFEDLRVPITTGICYFGDATGGDLRYHPEGPTGPPRRLAARHNTAAVLDTDSIYHGVERIGSPDAPAPTEMVAGSHLLHDGVHWTMIGPDGEQLATYDTDDVRISISWKAYWFENDEARDRFESARGALPPDEIEHRLLGDLRRRGLLGADEHPELGDIADLLIDTYERFPTL